MTTSQVQQIIINAAVQYNVDPNLAMAVAKQESGFNQNAVSSAGAIGVFQLMPATAAGLNVDPSNVTDNIYGGVAYLSQLLNQYQGNTQLALAAYNAGPGNVAKYGGVPPFVETQNYVSSIMGQLGNDVNVPTIDSSSLSSDVVSSTTDITTGIDLTDPTTITMVAGAMVIGYLILS